MWKNLGLCPKRPQQTMRLTPSVAVWIAVVLSACAGRPGAPVGGLPEGAAGLVLERPIEIPSGRARALFQGGRQVLSVGYYDPYCELVTATVSEQPQTLSPDRFAIGRWGRRLLQDPIAEIPPFLLGDFSCIEPLYQESRWQLGSDRQPGVLYLRCLVPYFHCGLGPPASLEYARTILGPDFTAD